LTIDKSRETRVIDVDPDETSTLLKKLIAVRSVNPSLDKTSSEKGVAELIASELERFGLEVRLQKVSDDRFNVIGQLTGEDPGRVIMLNGHMDTVNTRDPIPEPTLDADGAMHGRGACDMKGGLAAMMLALKKLKQSNRRLKASVQFSAVVDEEYLSVGTQKLLTEYRPSAVIVGEPTELKLAVAQKGAQRFEIETFGRAAHGSAPELGIDAIANMALVIQKIGQLASIRVPNHPLLGAPRIHASTIEGGSGWNVVPDYCKLRVERRSLPGESPSGLEIMEQMLAELSAGNKDFSGRVRLVVDRKPMETSKTERLVTLMQDVVERVLGKRPATTGVPYWTDAAHFAADHGIPTCIFGPGSVAQAHADDEYVSIDQVIKAAQVYALVAELF